MHSLRRIVQSVGLGNLAFVLIVPVLVAGIVFQMSPQLVQPNWRAAASIPVDVVTGSYASYEAATAAADFRTAYQSPDAAAAAAKAADVTVAKAAAALASNRVGDTTTADVAFDAKDGGAAEAGLRAASETALRRVLSSRRERLRIANEGLERQRQDITRRIADPAASAPAGQSSAAKEVWLTSEKRLLDQTTTLLATRGADLAAATMAESSIDSVVASVPVSTTQLSSQTDQIRMVSAAALTSFVVALILALLARRLLGRRGSGGSIEQAAAGRNASRRQQERPLDDLAPTNPGRRNRSEQGETVQLDAGP